MPSKNLNDPRLPLALLEVDDPLALCHILAMAHRAATANSIAFLQRTPGRLVLLLLSVGLFTLALAPVKQFYLAWVALVPWLFVVAQAKTTWRAFIWSWLAGTACFSVNMWWMIYITGPGAIALMIYLGLYWALAALLMRRLGWVGPDRRGHSALTIVLAIATLVTGLDWVRGALFTGLPWMYLGHSQSPWLLVCQIADITGVYGITFAVAALNGLVFVWLNRKNPGLRAATIAVGVLWLALIGYGVFRWNQTASVTTPGPTVLAVQANYPQDNKTGDKGATESERFDFHYTATLAALGRSSSPVDLVCWSETMMPPLNDEFRDTLRDRELIGRDGQPVENPIPAIDAMARKISQLARDHTTSLLVGAVTYRDPDDRLRFRDRRNSALLYRPDAAAPQRADKIHLVPFGEFIPFKRSTYFHWLHDFFQSFSPYDFDYTLTPGSDESPVVMQVPTHSGKPVRVVVPICFEDIDAALTAWMFRGKDGHKNADLLVNLTNDGWFKANENSQHLQAAIFRSIENRVPTARSVNTGISALIDSYGRVLTQVTTRQEGVAVGQVPLDGRYTFYTRFGEVFAIACVVIIGGVITWQIARRWSGRG